MILEPNQIKSLLLRINEGDHAAFTAFFNHYYPRLVSIAMSFVPGVVSAQEVISDVFYKILRNPSVLLKVNDFDNYMYQAVRNQSYTYLKKNQRRNLHDTIDQKEDYLVQEIKNPENSMISDELFSLVSHAIQELPPKRKAIFMLVKEEGKKYREVAEILGVSVKTVELQMSNALKKLRAVVKEYQDSSDVKIRKINKSGLLNFFFSL
jgi:RNA polymerase sigma-70 factor (ECF subfamily)